MVAGSSFELGVAGDVIAVRVRVRHDEGHRVASVSLQPARDDTLHHLVDIGAAGAGVEHEDPGLAEDQIEKRLLVVRAARLPEDDEIGVVLVHLEVRIGRAVGPAHLPPVGKDTRRYAGAVWLRRLSGGHRDER